jgi:hypothetical protein
MKIIHSPSETLGYQNYFCSIIYCAKVYQHGENNKITFQLLPSLIWLLRWRSLSFHTAVMVCHSEVHFQQLMLHFTLTSNWQFHYAFVEYVVVRMLVVLISWHPSVGSNMPPSGRKQRLETRDFSETFLSLCYLRRLMCVVRFWIVLDNSQNCPQCLRNYTRNISEFFFVLLSFLTKIRTVLNFQCTCVCQCNNTVCHKDLSTLVERMT